MTWQGAIIDGHNRYAICTRNGIEFETVEMDFESREAAEDWMDANQLGRRNLSKDQYTLLLGRRYNRTKKKITNPDGIGGKANKIDDGKSCHQQSQTTAQKLAKEYGVSEKTVRNAGEYAEAVEKLKDEPIIAKTRKDIVKAAALIDTAPEQSRAILSGEKSAADVTREVKRAEVIAKLEDVAAVEQKRLEGKYDVIVIDPPWPMEKIERDERPNQAAFDYPTMNEGELSEMKLPASDDCHMWLWTTHKFLPMAFRLLEKWGFRYVCTFVWHKPGGFQPIGLPQYNCEFALYARKGSPKLIDTKALPTCFNAPRGAHSEKPEEFYDVIRRVTAGRRIDIFSRRAITGFDTWGKEAK